MTETTPEDLEKCIQSMIIEAKAIVSCNSTKQIDQFFLSITDKKHYMSTLVNLLAISEPLSIQSRQQLASLLNLFLKDGLQYYDYTWTVQLLFKLVTNWRVPFAVKTLLHYGFSAILLHWNKELDNFFENVMIVLANMMEFVHNNFPSECTPYQSQPIYTKLIPEPFVLTFLVPIDLSQIYHTILFMLQSMLENLTNQLQSKEYIFSILAVFRKMQGIIMSQDNIIQLPSLMKLNVSAWQTLLNMISDLTPSLKFCIEEVSQWPELSHQIQYIYRFKSMPVDNLESNLLTIQWYNYLQWTQQWQNNNLLNLKEQIVRIHIRILTLSQNQKSFLAKQLHGIIANDLIPSLRYLSINRAGLAQYQVHLAQAYLSLLKMFIKIGNISNQEMLEIIQIIVLPLLDFQMKTHRVMFEEDTREFLKQIENCCELMDYGSILSQISNVIEEICDKSQPIFQQLTKYSLYSLENNQATNDNLALMQTTSSPILDATSAFLILSILSYKSLNNSSLYTILKNLITPEFYAKLDDYKRSYLFILLSYSWNDMYLNNQEEGVFLFKVGIDQNASPPLQIFGLDFILNICDTHFDKDFTFYFISRFAQLAKYQSAWEILQKITINFIQHFSQDTTCEIVRTMRTQAEIYMNQLLNQSHNQDDSSNAFRCLHICRSIAEAQDYCQNKPSVQNQLFLVTGMLTQMSKIQLDDEVVEVAARLLNQFQTPPADFISLLDAVAETFKKFQFQGAAYFSFFDKYMFINSDPEISFKLYSIVFQGLFFFATYPDSRIDMSQNLNNHILLLQNYLLLHGDKLTKRDLNDILTATYEIFKRLFQNNLSEEREQIIRARNRNLHLLCCLYLNLDLPLQQLLVESKQHVYRQYDAIVLVYILTKTQAAFFEIQEQCKLLQIFLNLLRTRKLSKSNNQNDKIKQMKRCEELKKFNKILKHIDLPVKLELTLQRQINLCLKIFMDKGIRFEEAFKMMQKTDSEDLRQLLQEKQEGERSPQKPTQQIKDRKILRVVGKKERADISMLDSRHQNKIRSKPSASNLSESEEEDINFEGQKRRKISQQKRDKSRSARCLQKMLKKQQKQ